MPNQITCGNGVEFKNSVGKHLLKIHEIKKQFVSSQHLESNGINNTRHSSNISDFKKIIQNIKMTQ